MAEKVTAWFMRSRYCLVHNLEDLFLKPHCCYGFACDRNSLPLTPTWRNINVVGQRDFLKYFFKIMLFHLVFFPIYESTIYNHSQFHLPFNDSPWEIRWFNPKRWLKHSEPLGVVIGYSKCGGWKRLLSWKFRSCSIEFDNQLNDDFQVDLS